jgi:hypothetical protein
MVEHFFIIYFTLSFSLLEGISKDRSQFMTKIMDSASPAFPHGKWRENASPMRLWSADWDPLWLIIHRHRFNDALRRCVPSSIYPAHKTNISKNRCGNRQWFWSYRIDRVVFYKSRLTKNNNNDTMHTLKYNRLSFSEGFNYFCGPTAQFYLLNNYHSLS